jgi:hypothetical protein
LILELRCRLLPAERCPPFAAGVGTGRFGVEVFVSERLVRRPWSIFRTSMSWSMAERKSVLEIAFTSRATIKWFSNSELEPRE